MAVRCIFVAHLGAPAFYLSAHIRDLTKIHVQLCSTRTTRACLRLFCARTAENTFVDMTLGCARMWVAHTEFHTCSYATGENVRRNHEWPDKCFVWLVNVRCPAVISHTEVADVQAVFPNLFKGLGKMSEGYTICLKSDAQPFVLPTPTQIPIPLIKKVEDELLKIQVEGVISKVDQPTDWCSGKVIVPKSKGRMRICVDLSELNESVKRERLLLPTGEHTLAQLQGSSAFSKLDINSGFWQVSLSKESALPTPFITQFGRLC